MLPLFDWQDSISNHTKHIHWFPLTYQWHAQQLEWIKMSGFNIIPAEVRRESWLRRIHLLCHAVIISPTGRVHLSHLYRSLGHLLLTAPLYTTFSLTRLLYSKKIQFLKMSNMLKYFEAMLTSVTKQQIQSRTVALIRMPRLCLCLC